MQSKYSGIVLIIILAFSLLVFNSIKTDLITGAPPYGESETDIQKFLSVEWIKNWKRPEGPIKVALQAGHYRNNELPDELEKLRGNTTGSTGNGKDEWEVNLKIAELVAQQLKESEIDVEILPATVPKDYWADVFIAIHADGSLDRSKSGFKVAAPWRDFTGNANKLASNLETTYQEATGLSVDPNVTRNMRGYYAFSWRRYDHAIHPMTTAVIFETGFLTNSSDQKLLINSPEIPAKAIAEGVLNYLNINTLLID